MKSQKVLIMESKSRYLYISLYCRPGVLISSLSFALGTGATKTKQNLTLCSFQRDQWKNLSNISIQESYSLTLVKSWAFSESLAFSIWKTWLKHVKHNWLIPTIWTPMICACFTAKSEIYLKTLTICWKIIMRSLNVYRNIIFQINNSWKWHTFPMDCVLFFFMDTNDRGKFMWGNSSVLSQQSQLFRFCS